MELRQHIKRQKVFADSTQTLFQGVRRHPAAAPTLPKLEVKTPKASLSGEDNVFPQISLSSWNDFKTWYLFGIHCSFANMGFVHSFVVFMWVVWDYWIVWDCWGSMVVWVSCIRGFILPMDYLYVYIYIYTYRYRWSCKTADMEPVIIKLWLIYVSKNLYKMHKDTYPSNMFFFAPNLSTVSICVLARSV